MYELKTKKNDLDVLAFIESIENPKRKVDAKSLMDLIQEISDDEPKMWGSSIVGYGSRPYKNAKNEENDWFVFGFSPRKQSLSLYVYAYSDDIYQMAKKAGLKHGKGCVYIKDFDVVDKAVIKEMILFTINQK